MKTINATGLKARLLVLFFISTNMVFSQPVRIKNHTYKLAFSDEFSGKSLDTNKWHYRTDSKHWSTQLAKNIEIKNGSLHINLKKEMAGGKFYTGGGLISKDTFGFGYYETRMKTPKGAGWHSSFWLMNYDGTGGTNPAKSCLEIDIIENDSKINLGYRTNLHVWKSNKVVGGEYVSSEMLNQEFQTLACLYRADSLFYFYNGVVVDKKDVSLLPKNGMNIWLTCIASFLGGTESVNDDFLPASLDFEYVRFYR